MTYEAKESLLSKINRDSPASKVMDFYERATEAIFELEFYQEAKKYLTRGQPHILLSPSWVARLAGVRLPGRLAEFGPQSEPRKLRMLQVRVTEGPRG